MNFGGAKYSTVHHVLLPRATSTPTSGEDHTSDAATATLQQSTMPQIFVGHRAAAILHATAATVKRPVPDGEVPPILQSDDGSCGANYK